MSLERRLRDALGGVDDYMPAPDLFARVTRSIDEDREHRRRVRSWILASTLTAVSSALFIGSLAKGRATSGPILVDAWATELVAVVLMTMILFAFGPSLRRLGRDLVADVFHLAPEQGRRFLSLLDIAYYLIGVGIILLRLDVTGLGQANVIHLGLGSIRDDVAILLLALGAGHVGNLIAFPVAGLFLSATQRRIARAEAGDTAPPISPAARRADRLVSIAAYGVVITVLAGVLVVIGLGLGT